MSFSSIRAFNPFNLQKGANPAWHLKVQEVIYYGESRFREAVAHISQADERHQFWMQQTLKREVVRMFDKYVLWQYNTNRLE